MAGEIALLSPDPDAARAHSYFDRALAVAGAQQAKSWKLRAAMSMAGLWRDQGKPKQARDILAPSHWVHARCNVGKDITPRSAGL